jgi:phage protein D
MEIDKRGKLTFNNVKIPIRVDKQAQAAEPENVDATLQFNQYDILFLLQLAHRNGYDLVLKSEEKAGRFEQYLYFGPSTLEPPQYLLLEWGKSLVQFAPALKTMKQVKELTVKSWNALKGKPISVTVERKDLPTRALQDEDRLYRIEQGFSERAEVVADRPFRSDPEARKYALGLLSDISKNLVTAHGSTLGTTGIRAGQKIEVQNIGLTFSGPYFITSSTHAIGAGGYITEFDARLEVKK